MRAIQFKASIPRFIFSKITGKYVGKGTMCQFTTNAPEPQLPTPEWVKIKTKLGGICSDVNVIFLKDSINLEPITSFNPAIMGHENLGTIHELGESVRGFEIGDRVIGDPMLPCPTRGFKSENYCHSCKRGDFSTCENFTEGTIAPGFNLGFCESVGGSWGDYFCAHPFQLFKVPDKISDENAILVDSFTGALHAVMRHPPKDTDDVLVVGCGIIGLHTIRALRILGSKARIIALARYEFQGMEAKNAGADEVIISRNKKEIYRKVATLTDAKIKKPFIGNEIMIGGADVVYECAGTNQSIDDAIRFTRNGGILVAIGIPADITIDWGMIVSFEINIAPSFCSAEEDYEEKRIRCYQMVLEWMAAGKLDLSHMLTHKFRIEEFKKALKSVTHKGKNKVIKAVFSFEE
ncbi:MAG: zinc-dependent alcohol dehydrogenase [Candidatus Helarchaeota archaeon]